MVMTVPEMDNPEKNKIKPNVTSTYWVSATSIKSL